MSSRRLVNGLGASDGREVRDVGRLAEFVHLSEFFGTHDASSSENGQDQCCKDQDNGENLSSFHNLFGLYFFSLKIAGKSSKKSSIFI